jgi:TPR repeat protein
MHLLGQGVAVDAEAAYYWLILAEAQNPRRPDTGCPKREKD